MLKGGLHFFLAQLKRYNTDQLIAKLHSEVERDVALNCKKKYLHNINCITETLKTILFQWYLMFTYEEVGKFFFFSSL
jgi:hypothetical protein